MATPNLNNNIDDLENPNADDILDLEKGLNAHVHEGTSTRKNKKKKKNDDDDDDDDSADAQSVSTFDLVNFSLVLFSPYISCLLLPLSQNIHGKDEMYPTYVPSDPKFQYSEPDGVLLSL